MFTSQTTKDLPLPSNPAILVTIRKLSWTQREAAQKAAKKARHTEIIDLGGVEVPEYVIQDIVKSIVEKSAPAEVAASVTASVASAAPAEPDLLLTHDKLTVLVCGITAWTHTTVDSAGKTVPSPVDKAHIEDLDPEDAEALAREILALSVRPRTETERKNDSSGSISF